MQSFAQQSNILYDYETNTFNQNQELPAEQNLVFLGEISPLIDKVEIILYKNLNKQTIEYKAN